jgi:hypothetical protein
VQLKFIIIIIAAVSEKPVLSVDAAGRFCVIRLEVSPRKLDNVTDSGKGFTEKSCNAAGLCHLKIKWRKRFDQLWT